MNERPLSHAARVFGVAPAWVSEPDPSGVQVARFLPRGTGVEAHDDSEVFVTLGMSAHPMVVPAMEPQPPARVELVAVAPGSWQASYGANESELFLVETLLLLSRYPRATRSWLGNLHTVPTGAPPTDRRPFPGYLITADFATRLGKAPLDVHEGASPPAEAVGFLLVTPLFERELLFARQNGSEALLNRLFAFTEALAVDWGFFARRQRPDVTVRHLTVDDGLRPLVDGSQIVAQAGVPPAAQRAVAEAIDEVLVANLAKILAPAEPAEVPPTPAPAPVKEPPSLDVFAQEERAPFDWTPAVVALVVVGAVCIGGWWLFL